MEMTLAPGFRFNPTDQELIWHYLHKKVHGEPLPCNVVIDCDIYGGDNSWRKMFEDRKDESLYFFTKLRNWSTRNKGSSSRAVRATKFGTWKCQSDMAIHVGKKHIGSKRTFSFIEKKKEEEPKMKGYKKANGWTMHEYRLDGCLVDRKEACSPDYSYVISKISRPRCMRRHEGELGSFQIECLQHATSLEELKEDHYICGAIEMLPDSYLGIDTNDDWTSYFLEDLAHDNISFLCS